MTPTTPSSSLTTKEVYTEVVEEVYTEVVEAAWWNTSPQNLLYTFYALLKWGKWEKQWLTPASLNTKICPDATKTAKEIRNIIYARLILSEGKYKFLGENTISRLSPQKTDVVQTLSEDLIKAIKRNNLTSKWMTPAKIHFMWAIGEEKITAIGGSNIASEHMTLKKLHIIHLIEIEKIKAIGGENLANEAMTCDKIRFVSWWSVEEIQAFGIDEILQLSLVELEAWRTRKSLLAWL